MTSEGHVTGGIQEVADYMVWKAWRGLMHWIRVRMTSAHISFSVTAEGSPHHHQTASPTDGHT